MLGTYKGKLTLEWQKSLWMVSNCTKQSYQNSVNLPCF